MYLNLLDYNPIIRETEKRNITSNAVKPAPKRKPISFLFGSTGTGKTTLIDHIFDRQSSYISFPYTYKYLNILKCKIPQMRVLLNELTPKKPVKKQKIISKTKKASLQTFIVFDEIDKAKSPTLLKLIKTILTLACNSETLNIILISNDFRTFEAKFKGILKKFVLKIPFPPFNKKSIIKILNDTFSYKLKNNECTKDDLRNIINLVALKMGNKKVDIRQSLVLCNELLENQANSQVIEEVEETVPDQANKLFNELKESFGVDKGIPEYDVIRMYEKFYKRSKNESVNSLKENLEVLTNLGKIKKISLKKNIFYYIKE